MKRISLALHEETYELIKQEAKPSGKKPSLVILQTIMLAFPSDVLPCARCGKVISIEADEGSMREEGVFCNKHLPKETEE